MHLLENKEESTCDNDEDQGEVEDARLSRHHNPPVAVKLIPSLEGLPLLLQALPLVRGLHRCGAASANLTILALSHGLSNPEMLQRVHAHSKRSRESKGEAVNRADTVKEVI